MELLSDNVIIISKIVPVHAMSELRYSSTHCYPRYWIGWV